MKTFRTIIAPKSAFGTQLKGDTLFGQLCWAVRNRYGEDRLDDLLDGYRDNRPFVVVSDVLPTAHLPRPTLPVHAFEEVSEIDRKIVKKRNWLPLEAFDNPVNAWLNHCKSGLEVSGGRAEQHPQPHNSINRITNTSGNGFDPYSVEQYWYGNWDSDRTQTAFLEARLDIYIVLDDDRKDALTPDELRVALTDIGALGFGRDASIGLGKYEIVEFGSFELPAQKGANAWLTLAPCAPQDLKWIESRCFYQPFTRFGRHGDIAVHMGNPFKTPVLLVDTGAVLAPSEFRASEFSGQGIGGDGTLSNSLPRTVHQGYAPVVAIALPVLPVMEAV